jgi:cysteine synthase A
VGKEVTLHGVQPFGSVTFNSNHVEDPDIIIAGIGSAIEFKNVQAEFYDYIHWISFDYSRHGAIELLKKYGVFAGLSAGSCYTVANWCASTFDNQPCIFIAADMGYRYFEPVFQTYPQAKSTSDLYPTTISNIDELKLDWCVKPWLRQPFDRQTESQKSIVE